MANAQRRIRSLASLLAQLHQRLNLAFGFRLWDGSLIPPDWPASALAVAIADEGAVAALVRAPRITTLANLWAAKRIDIVNGTLLDLVANRPQGRTRDITRSVGRPRALKTALDFLFVPRGGPWPLEAIAPERRGGGAPDDNKKDIAHHYDVSNAFYRLWLDREMVYSCGYFHEWDDDLDTAQIQKLDMVCRKLRLRRGDSVLDIGCGWGAFACHAAQHYGVTVHGVTLSEQQIALARQKVERLGLADRVSLELIDYALLAGEGRFDKIASIGMFEHIGLDNFDAYFEIVRRLLKPGGLFLHHAITRPGGSHAARTGRRRADFAALTRYVFPGGELDYIGRTVTNLERNGFEIHDVEGWREHYQRTCKFWHDRLVAHYDAACREVGEVTTRVWIAYLAACSITFQRNNAGIYQTLASRRIKGSVGLPPTRADLYG
ncbi:MAG: cyclopropane-fatty-acyl-phospholipid synthase family protein [Roseiarcus sp.]